MTNPFHSLKKANHEYFHSIWQFVQDDDMESLSPADRLLAKIMLEHEEFHNQFEVADLLYDHKYEPGGLPLPDFFTLIAEKSIPADHETDLMQSEAILKIAQPHIDKYYKKDPHFKTILGLAVAAWNLPLIPKDYYQSATKKIAENMPTGLTLDQAEALLMLVFAMMKSRLYDYGTITDYIHETEINETEEGWNIRIKSTAKI